MECKVCGKECQCNEYGVCEDCDKKIKQRITEKRFCRNCGNPIEDNWEFCNNCGNKLNINEKDCKSIKFKKFFIIIAGCVVTFLIIFLILFLNRKTTIELNSANFNDYILLNVAFGDFEIDSGYYVGYVGRATLKATAKLKENVIVENVKINCRVSPNGLCWAGNDYKFTLEFDQNGIAEYETTVDTGAPLILKPDFPILCALNSQIKGDEFIVNEDVFVTVEGNIIK